MRKSNLKISSAIRLKRPEYETFFVFYLTMSYFIHIFNLTIRHFVGNTHKLDTLTLYLLLAFMFVLVIRTAIDRIRPWQIFGIFAEGLILTVFLLASPDMETHLTVLESVLTECFPLFLLSGCVRDCKKVQEDLLSVMTFVPYGYAFLAVAFGLGTLTEGTGYSQSDSYQMLLPAIVLASSLQNELSLKRLIPFGISLFFMFAYGARGPVACLALFIIVNILLHFEKRSRGRAVGFVAVLGVIAAAVYQYFYELLRWFQTLFAQLGFSIRTVDRLMNQSFFEDRGRNRIAEICIDRILEHPFIGIGPVNDRIYLANQFGNGEGAVGSYPHNFFLEILMQYGVILGGMMLLLFAFLILKALRTAPNANTKDLIVILIGSYFFPLLFSGSYLDSRGFYMLVAICAVICKNSGNEVSMQYQGVSRCEQNEKVAILPVQ